MTHEHLRFELLNSFKRNGNKNQDRCTTECDTRRLGEDDLNDVRKDSDNTKEESAEKGYFMNGLDDEVAGRLTGTDTRDCAAVVLDVVSYFYGIVLNRDVEIVKRNDKNECQNDVNGRCLREIFHNKLSIARVRYELSNSCRNADDSKSKDDGHNAGHNYFDGQVSALAAVHFSADLTFSVLDRDSSFCTVHENDEREHEKRHDNDDNGDIPKTVHYVSNKSHNECRTSGNDGSKKDHGDTVADTLFIDAFTEPHNEAGTCYKNKYDCDLLKNTCETCYGSKSSSAVCIGLKSYEVTQSLNYSNTYSYVTSDLVDLLTAFLAAFFGKTFKSGDSDCKKLDNNACINVRLNSQREDCAFGKCITGKHIQVTEKASLRVEICFKSLCVDKRYGNRTTDSEEKDNKQGVENLFPQVRDFPCVS